MQQSLGMVIRQLRREQNKTQTELGGTAFSKSYVSAIESGKLSPSREALQHFALGLGKPEHYFLTQAQQMSLETPGPLSEMASVQESEGLNVLAHEKSIFLETLFEQPEYNEIQTPESFFSLSAEQLALLPCSDQAHYAFFQGVMLQRKEDYTAAIESLERALTRENHPEHTAAILHALSNCYLQIHLPQTALSYALRAHRVVAQHISGFAVSSLPFRIALSAGHIALAMGVYQQALEQFEQARSLLNGRQMMKHVGQLYWGLGYCTYALAYQQASTTREGKDQIEQLYQRALAYLVQSHSIAQMSGERQEAHDRRLTLAMVQLDLCVWDRWRSRQAEREKQIKGLRTSSISSLLDEASEHCRQVLADLHPTGIAGENASLEQTKTLLFALALFIRVGVQRALLAYEQGYGSTFQREQSLVSALCQQTLDACHDAALIETLAWKVGNLTEMAADSSFFSLPRLPAFLAHPEEEKPWLAGLNNAEICFAAGEVAEMLGRTATSSAFISNCYSSADACFLRALEGLRRSHARDHSVDSGYVIRVYQRALALVEERLLEEKEHDASGMTRSLLTLFHHYLQASQMSPLPL